MRRTNDEHAERQIEIGIAFFHGWVSKAAEEFAQRLQIPAAELTGRLGELLSIQAGREPLGAVHHVPRVQRAPIKASQAVEQVAVANSASSNTAQEDLPRKGGPRVYWASMTKEQRSAEVKRRMKLWSPEARVKWRNKGHNKPVFQIPKLR